MTRQHHDTPEVAAISDFLHGCLPFDLLDAKLLATVARTVRVAYVRSGASPEQGAPCLTIVRSGAVDIRDVDGQLIDRCGAGDSFGAGTLLADTPRELHVVAVEDSLLYQVDGELFHRLRSRVRDFERFFHQQRARRLRRAVYAGAGNLQFARRIDELMSSDVLCCEPTAGIQDVAGLMADRRVSSILVTDQGRLLGIVTDRDLRNRVLAPGVSLTADIATVMTPDPVQVSADALLFDALMVMSEHDVHHLPVLRDARVVGVVSATDLLRTQRQDPLYVIHEIGRAADVDALRMVPDALRQILRYWIDGGARAAEVGRVLTSVSDAVTRRLLALAKQQLGPAPVAWAWLSFGSQGRAEQALGADQDNALLLAPEFDEARHGAYFAELAQYVCDGLASCGYRLCPGEIMAMNPRWRMALPAWQETFSRWIREPAPQALMHASIFFDLRGVDGDAGLVHQLREHVIAMARDNTIFLACLYGNVITHTPPLGFFRSFVLERSGEHEDRLDLKHRGVIPIVDIARLYALAAGVREVNTMRRLQALGGSTVLSLRDARSLADACEFIGRLRLEQQAEQLRQGQEPDNFLDPTTLSALRREQLKEAFALVRRAQQALGLKYGHR